MKSSGLRQGPLSDVTTEGLYHGHRECWSTYNVSCLLSSGGSRILKGGGVLLS